MPPTEEQVTTTAEKYVMALADGDLDAVVGLYADEATVEDPVGGGKILRGREQIREFYATVTALTCLPELGEIRVCGNELLFNFRLTTVFDEQNRVTIDVWDLMVLDEQCRVTSMKAYWGPKNMS